MQTDEVELKIETPTRSSGKHKYSAIDGDKDDERGYSDSEHDLQINSNDEKEDTSSCLLIFFLQQIMRESLNRNDEILSDIMTLCDKYIGSDLQNELESELNIINIKLFDYNNESHINDKINCFYGCKQTQHIKSFTLTILLLFLILWGIICDGSSYSVNTCNVGWWYDDWWLVIVCLLYIAYFIEFILSSTGFYLYNMYDINTFYQYIDKIRLLSPRIWLQFQCNDNPKKYMKSKHFVYSNWKDISDQNGINNLYLNKNVDEMNNDQLIKLKIDRFLVFKDDETAKICKEEWDNYITEEIQKKGEYFDKKDGISKLWAINDDDNKKNVLLNTGLKSLTISYWFYLMVSCLLCSSCYRVWFSSKTGKRRYKIVKQVSL